MPGFFWQEGHNASTIYKMVKITAKLHDAPYYLAGQIVTS